MHHIKVIKDGNVNNVVKEQLVDGVQYVDNEPHEGSLNGITSGAVAKVAEQITTAEGDIDSIEEKIPSGASSSNKLVTESGMEDALSAIGTGYTPKGNATVATLEALTGQSNGDMYIVTDSGTLNNGALVVSAGNSVAWDSTNEVWYKTNQYATQQEHDALTTYAHNVAASIAPPFDATRTSENPYKVDDRVIYQGVRYRAKTTHYGAWQNSHFDVDPVVEVSNQHTFTKSDVLNKVIKEMYFDTPIDTSTEVKVTILKNSQSGSLYRYGFILTIGGSNISVFSQRTNPISDGGIHYGSNNGVSVVYDLSDITATSTEIWTMLTPAVNFAEFSPYIYSKKKNDLQDTAIGDNAAAIALHDTAINAHADAIEDIDACFETIVNLDNVLDKENAPSFAGYPGSERYYEDSGVKSVYLPIKANTTYTVSVDDDIYHRFVAGSSAAVPVNGGACARLFSADSSHTNLNDRNYWVFTTPADAAYLCIYYYASSLDTEHTADDILDTIMVTEGDRKIEFTPYSEKKVIKESSLPDNVLAATQDDAFSTMGKSYGVVFDNSSITSTCQRVGDAQGKQSNYAIGSGMANGGRVNDFDNIYPWCNMRRCNILGGVVVAYEGDDDFEVDGSNGDVFVEIPKFYSFRSVVGNIETIVISGTKKSGFELEPAFDDGNGGEKDCIYVAAYATDVDGKSASGKLPLTSKNFNYFYDDAVSKGYGVFDLATLNAIQKLVIIENAEKNVSQYYEGFGELMYYGTAKANETATGVNTFEVVGSVNLRKIRAGLNCAIGAIAQMNNNIHKLTSYTDVVFDSGLNKYKCTVTIDGDPVDVVAGETQFYMAKQNNGNCDLTMTYHTGRGGENGYTGVRYRGMENLWGNTWDMIGGLLLKDLSFYFTYDKTKYKGDISEDYEQITDFTCPLHAQYAATNWLTANGLVKSNKLLILPKTINSAGQGSYSARVYSISDTDPDGNPVAAGSIFMAVSGGGWDHSVGNSPFTLRFWSLRGASSHLYGSRFVIR